MSTKWSDAAMKDLTFAVLMSSNNGNVNIKANWEKVEQYMKGWGHDFSKGAMSQQWTKKILKEFRLRHPEGNDDNNNSAPATPASKSGGSHAARTPKTPKTPASDKGQGKGKKRAKVEDDDDEGDSPFGSFVADPIAKTKTPRRSAKKVKHEMEEEADEDEGVDMQPKSEERDDDYDFALDV